MKNEELYEKVKDLSQEELNDRFIHACISNNIEIIKFLLSSPKLIINADVHTENDFGFKSAYSCNSLEVIKYLIFDMNIERTENIKDFLSYDPKEYIEEKVKLKNKQVNDWFKMQELKNDIDKQLNSYKIINKKIKL